MPGAPLAHSTCDPFSSASPQSSQCSGHWDPPSTRPTWPASKSCQTSNRPQSQLCGPGAAVSSLASVLDCEEVLAPATKAASLSLKNRAFAVKKWRGSSRVLPRDRRALGQLPRPPARPLLPAVPLEVIGAQQGHPGAPWASAQTDSRGREKEKQNTFQQTAPSGRRLGERCPGWEVAVPARNPGLFTEQDSQGFLCHSPGDFYGQHTVCQAPFWALAVVTHLLSQRTQRGEGQGRCLCSKLPESWPQETARGAGKRGAKLPGLRAPRPSAAPSPTPSKEPCCSLGLRSGPCAVTSKHTAVGNRPLRHYLSPESDITVSALASLTELLGGQSRLMRPL